MLMFIRNFAVLLIFCSVNNRPGNYFSSELNVFFSIPNIEKNGNYFNQKFVNPVTENKLPEDSTNKKYTTIWGGDITFWINDSSNGYTTRGLGQEIYKDNETKTIEKMVIPWLLLYTNQYRKEQGLDTLRYDQCLLKAAAYHTDYLFNESKKDHHFKLGHYQDSTSLWFKGKAPSDRAMTAGCKKYCGENALYTFLLPVPANNFTNRQKLNLAAQKISRDMVYDQWHNSRGHRDNMLFTGYTCLGVSVAIGKHYSNDTYINDKGEMKILKENNSSSWVAFGIQVMAY